MRWNLALFALACGLCPNLVAADTLSGVVRDPQGRPVAGARVDIATAAPKVGPALFCPTCYVDCARWTTSDAEGKFAIAKLNPSLKFRILASASGRLSAMTKAVDPARDTPEILLEPIPPNLPPERTLSGRVVDGFGHAIPGALIDPGGAETPKERWWGAVDEVRPTVSDDDGRFLLILDQTYRGLDLEVTAAGFAGTLAPLLAPGAREHTITVPTGARVTGHLLADGKPLAGAPVAVVQLNRTSGNHFIKAVAATTDASGRFEFANLPASQGYAIFSNVPGNSPTAPVLATRTFKVPADGATRDLGTLTAVAPLSLSGRIVMPEGAKVPPEARVTFGRDPAWDLVAVPVAEDGTFSVAPLPPETYVVRVIAKGFEADPSGLPYQARDAGEFGVRVAGSITNLTIPLKPAGPTPRPETAGSANPTDLDRVARTQNLSGVVLDFKGDPVPGVEVVAKLADSYSFLHRVGDRPPPWAETDVAGRFALEQLPDLPIELMVYRKNPRGGSVLHPAKARPARDQKDIRIRFDPRLALPPEDLDAPAATKPGGKP